MADSEQEKTEQATERRIEEFRKQGKIATSKELSAAIAMIASACALLWALPAFADGMHEILRACRDHFMDKEIAAGDLTNIAAITGRSVGGPMVAVLLAGSGVSLAGGLTLTGFNLSSEALEPKWERLDFFATAKQLWASTTPWFSLAKSLLVTGCIAWAAWASVSKNIDALPVLATASVGGQMMIVKDLVIDLLSRALPVALAIGAADYGYQRWTLSEQMKMTKQEVKEEHKDQEGDPMIKAKRRARARQLAMNTMLRDVAKADVIIANPTHYAIALRYRRDENAAPMVVARGVDHMALKIRAAASQHEIMVIENRPLARALYAVTKVGAAIPKDFYGPVAQVLAVVFKARRAGRG